MRKKRLAILINALEVAGAEKVISEIINHFYNEFDIHLILLNDTIEFELPFNDITITVIDNSNLRNNSRIIDIAKIPMLALRLKKYLEKNNIYTCFSALNRSNFINCFLKIYGWKGAVLISERSHTASAYPNDTIAGRTGRFLVKWLYKKADVIVPNSKGIEYNLVNYFNLQKSYKVIYNPINLAAEDSEMLQPIEDVDINSFTFIHVGRFEKSKNHQLVLDAINKIKEHDFKVLFIGQGNTFAGIKQKAKEMGLIDKVVFLGYRKNVAKYMANAQCSLMSSAFEGFPNVLLESLSCNTPIISTDCPTGPRELLDDIFIPDHRTKIIEKCKYGVLVPLNDPELFSKAMVMMMEDKELLKSYANKGRERAADFGLPIIMQQYHDLFTEN